MAEMRSCSRKRIPNGLICLLLVVSSLVGCSGLAIVDALAPKEGYVIRQATSYGLDPRQVLDIYRPDQAPARAPTVIFFYGGGWREGRRAQYRFVAQALSSRGYTVVIPDYRLYPQVRFPEFVEDGALAVAWVLNNLEGNKVVLMGHSAGAHLAAMLVTDERYLDAVGVESGQVSGLVGLAGPYDFLPLRSAHLRAVFGPEEEYPLTQPVNFVTGSEPPALLLHGAEDTSVRPGNSRSLAERWNMEGGQAQLNIYPGLGHAALLGSLTPSLQRLAPTLDVIDEFLREIARSRELSGS